MTAARRTPSALPQPPFTGDQPSSPPADTSDTSWLLAMRALLLLHSTVLPPDPLIAALSDADVIALRGSLMLLQYDEAANIA